MIDYTEIIAFGLLFLFTCYAVFKSTFQYKINSLIIYLQWAILLAEAIYVCQGATGLFLILPPLSPLEKLERYKKINISSAVLSSVNIAITNLVHWTLAFKYWSVAKRLQLAIAEEDPHSFRKQSNVIFIVGVVCNLCCACFDVWW